MNENITKLRTDAEKAQDYRKSVTEALFAACLIMDQARADGLVINFNIAPDAYGRHGVQNLSVVKPL